MVLVEKEPSIGGHMSQLSETFPTLDCSQCILTPRMVEVYQHPRIKLMAYSEVEAVEGYIGNFTVKIRQKARARRRDEVQRLRRVPEGLPEQEDPERVRRRGSGKRTAIYVPFPQAVPNIPVIDRDNCAYFKGRAKGVKKDACGKCAEACGRERRSTSTSRTRFVTEKVGAIVVATGYQLYSDRQGAGPPRRHGLRRVRLRHDPRRHRRAAVRAAGLGLRARPAGRSCAPPTARSRRRIVFLQCIGSRDPAKGIEYCSKICCMYVAKHTMLYRHKVHDGKATVFYMDIRAGGKGYDEFMRRAIEEDGARLPARPRLADVPRRRRHQGPRRSTR